MTGGFRKHQEGLKIGGKPVYKGLSLQLFFPGLIGAGNLNGKEALKSRYTGFWTPDPGGLSGNGSRATRGRYGFRRLELRFPAIGELVPDHGSVGLGLGSDAGAVGCPESRDRSGDCPRW